MCTYGKDAVGDGIHCMLSEKNIDIMGICYNTAAGADGGDMVSHMALVSTLVPSHSRLSDLWLQYVLNLLFWPGARP